jgi:putative component of toxin-antitoxin plasmid stabilization module
MQSFPFELEYYITAKGKKPFKEWLDGLKDVSASRQKNSV